MVNRVWQQHFGKGLVETPSDFGKLGEAPSHPELLDWLAARFVEDGWSLKALHRRMMLSAAYSQGTENPNEEAARRVDPTNRLVWTRPVRRLEAESIRDAMLATSGELDLREGGASAESKEPRRTVYTKVLRNKRDPLLDAFDGPDGYFSTSVRNVTTTPTQSLLMINGAWTLARAEAFASRLLEAEARDDRERVRLAYRLAFGREAGDAEVEEAMAFLATQSGRIRGGEDAVARACENPGPRMSTEAWADLAHAILNANEFLYVD
jgi:hypothetical protein